MSDQEMQFADPEWHASPGEAARLDKDPQHNPSAPEDDREFVISPSDSDKLIASLERPIKRRVFALGLLIAGAGVATGGLGWWLIDRTAQHAIPSELQGKGMSASNSTASSTCMLPEQPTPAPKSTPVTTGTSPGQPTLRLKSKTVPIN